MKFTTVSTAMALFGAVSDVQGRFGMGPCPDAELVQDFDPSLFEGKWFEIERDALFTWEMGQTCTTQQYQLTPEGDLDLYFRCYIMMMGF